MHPISVQITTRDSVEQREIHRNYAVETRHPRWELVKIFWDAFVSLKFR